MRRTFRLGLALLFAVRLAHADAPEPATLLGFSTERSTAERAIEQQLDRSMSAADQREWMKRLSAHPHHLGSPYGKQNAEFIAELYRSFGFDTRIEEFRVLFPTPKLRKLELVAPTSFTASLAEPAIPGDSTSGQTAEMLPPYNVYSIDGDATAELVYVNYGIPSDYEELDRRGIDVKGKIVIARYGHSWRGIKPKVAAEHGALACILYSDPADDGYGQGDVYPKGGWRSDQAVQRGSVSDGPLRSGDPLTPGIGATADAPRIDRKDAATLTKIPVLPISYADALPFLRALGGPVAPESYRGGLPMTYHLGPGPAKVHLALAFNWDMATVYDVIATLSGAELPDQWVIRGNHHDAWVHGATDPLSGQVAMLAEAKAIGALAKSGWKPRRTIVYASWDGEEPGLLGSVEWAETHAVELQAKVVAYINSDSNARGFLGLGGSHSLEAFLNDVARDVVDPEKGVSAFERARSYQRLNGTPDEKREARDRANLRINALGSGSDYTPFLQHLGIASVDVGYGGEDEYGQYHTAYDSFDHFVRFVDPDFTYGVALAQTGSRTVLRLAQADVLPFEFTGFADNLALYADQVRELADGLRTEAEDQNRLIADGAYAQVFDPKKTYVAPKPKDPVPYLNFAPLQNAVAAVQKSAKAFSAAAADRARSGRPYEAAELENLGKLLIDSERALTRPEGLPGRPWFIHQIYAPGFYTGYGVKTLPGIREAIEARNWDLTAKEVELVAGTLRGYAAQIDKATAALGGR
ncbi:MAG TPA: M28 family metallopeptidase [Thermoanaerobaculia bacterium]|jgi:N-acetylated-alpha-linked acidic dipeptidase|nr:M28 family metallopeptidase [Thermoanaerobaculia bacterium]